MNRGSVFSEDNWKGELFNIDDGITFELSIENSPLRTLTEGELWGEFGNIPIEANVYYSDGEMHYNFSTTSFNEVIQGAIDNSLPIMFTLKTVNGVMLVTIEENFSYVTRIVDLIEGERKNVGVSFDGSIEMDTMTWRGISKLGTRFIRPE